VKALGWLIAVSALFITIPRYVAVFSGLHLSLVGQDEAEGRLDAVDRLWAESALRTVHRRAVRPGPVVGYWPGGGADIGGADRYRRFRAALVPSVERFYGVFDNISTLLEANHDRD